MEESKTIIYNGVALKVFKDGNVYKKDMNEFILNNGFIHKTTKISCIEVNRKGICRHRLVAHAFLDLDINGI